MSAEQEIAFIRAQIAKLEAEIEALSEEDTLEGGGAMTPERAIEILTPGKAKFSPPEYDEALELAREALARYGQYKDTKTINSGDAAERN